MGDKAPPHLHIQHGEPPVYYCWKYWMANGEMREGCTPVEPNEDWPDLNDYGWVYIAVPIAILFVVIFVTSLVCRKGSSNSVAKQPLLDDTSDFSDEDVVDAVPRNSRAPVVMHAVPYRKSTGSDFYSVVKMAKMENVTEGPKVPLQGGVSYPSAPHHAHSQQAQPRLYPKLSTMKRQSAGASPVRVANGKAVNMEKNRQTAASNNYVTGPTAAPKGTGRRNTQREPEPTKVLEELDSTSEEEEVTDHELDSEEENLKHE